MEKYSLVIDDNIIPPFEEGIIDKVNILYEGGEYLKFNIKAVVLKNSELYKKMLEFAENKDKYKLNINLIEKDNKCG